MFFTPEVLCLSFFKFFCLLAAPGLPPTISPLGKQERERESAEEEAICLLYAAITLEISFFSFNLLFKNKGAHYIQGALHERKYGI